MPARVMVVEDEESLCALLEYNLTKEGYKVSLVTDGEDAIYAIVDERPDLIVLDWMLPHVSGIEICRQIRARNEVKDTPVIMLTARGEEDDRIRGLETGADDYLTKPFSMTELMARIRAVLRRSRPTLAGDVATFGDIVLDRQSHRVRRGDRVITNGGLIGTVTKAGDNELTVQVAEGVRVQDARGMIADVQAKGQPADSGSVSVAGGGGEAKPAGGLLGGLFGGGRK